MVNIAKPISLTDAQKISLDDKKIAEYESVLSELSELKTLTDTQRVLKRLIEKDNKSKADVSSIKSLIRLYKDEKKIADDAKAKLEKQRQKLHSAFVSAVDKNLMFNHTVSYRDVLQKMIADKLLDDKLFSDFVTNEPAPAVENNAPPVPPFDTQNDLASDIQF